jgi:tetratricopeptide (TPR) repeat protein
MNKIMLLFFLGLSIILNVRHVLAASPDELYFQAGQAYKSGNFQEAGRLYTELTANGSVSGHIYYNLGNTFFRQGDLGRAILNYERARLLMPRDADLTFNLGFARDRTHDAVEPVSRPLAIFFFWLDSFSVSEVFGLFAIINLLFFAALALRLTFRREWTFSLFVTILVFWAIAGPCLAVKWYQSAADSRAVILASEVDVLAGPDPKDTELFKLHAGTLVHAERDEAGWTLIRIADDKRGWVKSEAIGLVVESKG